MNNNSVHIIWLGQGSFLFDFAGTRLVIDPFYSDIVEEKLGFKRLMDSPLTIEELKPDFLFITHDHVDHFDPIALPQINKRYPNVPIIGPRSITLKAKEYLTTEAIIKSIEIGDKFSIGNLKLTITPAFHSDPFAVGCLIEANGKIIYHTADTLLTDSLIADVEHLSENHIDVLIACINGKMGNMSWKDAVNLADSLKPNLVIPMHYGMFAENTEDPGLFLSACQKLSIEAKELIPGKPFII